MEVPLSTIIIKISYLVFRRKCRLQSSVILHKELTIFSQNFALSITGWTWTKTWRKLIDGLTTSLDWLVTNKQILSINISVSSSGNISRNSWKKWQNFTHMQVIGFFRKWKYLRNKLVKWLWACNESLLGRQLNRPGWLSCSPWEHFL